MPDDAWLVAASYSWLAAVRPKPTNALVTWAGGDPSEHRGVAGGIGTVRRSAFAAGGLACAGAPSNSEREFGGEWRRQRITATSEIVGRELIHLSPAT